MIKPRMCDSRGKESTTLFFVTIAFLALLLKFIFAGVTFGDFGTMPEMSAAEFSGSIAAVLAIWLGREWTEKKTATKDESHE